jgi:hypothetical protein
MSDVSFKPRVRVSDGSGKEDNKMMSVCYSLSFCFDMGAQDGSLYRCSSEEAKSAFIDYRNLTVRAGEGVARKRKRTVSAPPRVDSANNNPYDSGSAPNLE